MPMRFVLNKLKLMSSREVHGGPPLCLSPPFIPVRLSPWAQSWVRLRRRRWPHGRGQECRGLAWWGPDARTVSVGALCSSVRCSDNSEQLLFLKDTSEETSNMSLCDNSIWNNFRKYFLVLMKITNPWIRISKFRDAW